jgi:hypothetical protein
MPFSLQLKFTSFRHQSSESTPYRIYSYQGHIACHSVVTGTTEIQQLLITSQTYQLLKLMMKKEKPLALLSNSPSYLAFHRPILQTSIQCCSFLSHS